MLGRIPKHILYNQVQHKVNSQGHKVNTRSFSRSGKRSFRSYFTQSGRGGRGGKGRSDAPTSSPGGARKAPGDARGAPGAAKSLH
ncbi:hypothetical protein M8J76_014469 [Diaphorina citri]|nr:hypothetical protein M8J76_014469 [Diaphorina citri]